MAEEKCVILVMVLVNSMAAEKIEGFIVGGNFTKIEDVAHSAYVSIRRIGAAGLEEYFTCGSSVLNQATILTAAHCLEECDESTTIFVLVGHEDIEKASAIPVASFLVHENYDPVQISNDLALLVLRHDIKFGRTVRRVWLMAEPPYHSPAVVAGWGIVDEKIMIASKKLKFVRQHVLSRASCHDLLPNTPVGTFCAGLRNGEDYAAEGDSGSALIVHKFIQIGLVSFKNPSVSRSVVFYTDVGYFYHWIRSHAKSLYCVTRKHKK